MGNIADDIRICQKFDPEGEKGGYSCETLLSVVTDLLDDFTLQFDDVDLQYWNNRVPKVMVRIEDENGPHLHECRFVDPDKKIEIKEKVRPCKLDHKHISFHASWRCTFQVKTKQIGARLYIFLDGGSLQILPYKIFGNALRVDMSVYDRYVPPVTDFDEAQESASGDDSIVIDGFELDH